MTARRVVTSSMPDGTPAGRSRLTILEAPRTEPAISSAWTLATKSRTVPAIVATPSDTLRSRSLRSRASRCSLSSAAIASRMAPSWTAPRSMSIWSVTLTTPRMVPATISARRLAVQFGTGPDRTTPPFTRMTPRRRFASAGSAPGRLVSFSRSPKSPGPPMFRMTLPGICGVFGLGGGATGVVGCRAGGALAGGAPAPGELAGGAPAGGAPPGFRFSWPEAGSAASRRHAVAKANGRPGRRMGRHSDTAGRRRPSRALRAPGTSAQSLAQGLDLVRGRLEALRIPGLGLGEPAPHLRRRGLGRVEGVDVRIRSSPPGLTHRPQRLARLLPGGDESVLAQQVRRQQEGVACLPERAGVVDPAECGMRRGDLLAARLHVVAHHRRPPARDGKARVVQPIG